MSINNNETVNLETEIRKLQPLMIDKLTMILNVDGSWKKLMAIVPKDDESGQNKFISEHFRLIEQGSRLRQKGCAEIFLEEWGTMGKKRPTVGKLLDLLTKAELFRAADYIAIDVLNRKESPKRPNSGPAAQIDIDSLLPEYRDIVGSSSLIAVDIHRSSSFQNEVQNSPELIPQEQVSYQIPTFLNQDFSSTSEFSNTDSTHESHSKKETQSSEVEGENISFKLPRCLESLALSSDETTNEFSQSASENAVIPRLVLNYTVSE
ncbi:protein Tube [Belonocnema kinseyi]|uniref:protein Tube n=1 Tax=Belonocnema kinseyi TaxID=2817044 RepID=UPI00143D6D42|nr:protein Tube [Belonocnema kinseyi]